MDVVRYSLMFVLGYLMCYWANPRKGEPFKPEIPTDALEDGDIIKVRANSERYCICDLVNSSDIIAVFDGGNWDFQVGKIYKFIKVGAGFSFKCLT